jgi:hypothetical protein
MPPAREPKKPTKQTFSKLKASKYSYVIINGLCFLHYDPTGKNLLVTAPEVMDHVYLRGCPSSGQSLTTLETDLDFTAPGLLTGNDKRRLVFRPELPQFSESLTGPIQREKARFRATLPKPLAIFMLRRGRSQDFHPLGKVGKAIEENLMKAHDPQLGLLICLRFGGKFKDGWTAPGCNVLHLYCENQFPLGTEHVNHALMEAGELFPKGLDLRVDERFHPPFIQPQDPHLPLGPDGELDLDELQESVNAAVQPGMLVGAQAGASVTNCCSFGILPDLPPTP